MSSQGLTLSAVSLVFYSFVLNTISFSRSEDEIMSFSFLKLNKTLRIKSIITFICCKYYEKLSWFQINFTAVDILLDKVFLPWSKLEIKDAATLSTSFSALTQIPFFYQQDPIQNQKVFRAIPELSSLTNWPVWLLTMIWAFLGSLTPSHSRIQGTNKTVTKEGVLCC